MKRLTLILATAAVTLLGWGNAFAQDSPGFECDNSFGACGTPNQSGGGGCGCGGGSILINNTDLGDTYQFADDYDDDGWEDDGDNCARVLNPDQADSDGDGIGDACDICLSVPDELQFDIDGDMIGDACDTDIDGDGLLNADDNCETMPNPILPGLTAQIDTDLDGLGDACDDDIDNDGITNLEDGCPLDAQITTPTSEQQASCFPDADGDGIWDALDNCSSIFNPDQANLNGSSFGDECDPDVDGDGVHNPFDNCAQTPNPDQIDSDRDGQGEACDSRFCYTVFGDTTNCLDPEGALSVYSPGALGTTGQPELLRLFANRESQPMEYTWRVVSTPDGADYRLENAKGTVTISSPYEYRYLSDEAARLVGSKAGDYELELTVKTVWEDRKSGIVNDTANFRTVVSLTGDDADVNTGTGDSAGCQVANANSGAGSAAWLLLVGLVGLVIRRRKN